MYSPYDGVVKEIVVAEDETAYLEKPLIIFEVEDTEIGDPPPSLPSLTAYMHC